MLTSQACTHPPVTGGVAPAALRQGNVAGRGVRGSGELRPQVLQRHSVGYERLWDALQEAADRTSTSHDSDCACLAFACLWHLSGLVPHRPPTSYGRLEVSSSQRVTPNANLGGGLKHCYGIIWLRQDCVEP